LKRDDQFAFAGVRGGKVRSCLALVTMGPRPAGLITAGSRHSPQVHIVAAIGRELGLPVRVHVPQGEDTDETLAAANLGAEVVRHPHGYNSVIVARCNTDAEANQDWRLVPFGMECTEAVQETADQVPSWWPSGVHRIVVPVGSGMSLAGIHYGMLDHGQPLPILGVRVGAEPEGRLTRWAPLWRFNGLVSLVNSAVGYGTRVVAAVDGVQLDPVYEAKCVPFLEPGDLLWVVGCRDHE
jgi:1-aminocyclopropane-1-carboxylate deaminase/D-cysteine desulfhydrase-like pyridoxal-dependent ACC family enzyme